MTNVHQANLDRAFQNFINNPRVIAAGYVEHATNAYNAVSITWNSRLRTTAGRAHRLGLRIDLSPYIFDKMSEEEQWDTVSHEFAHIVDYVIRGTSNHDRFWKSIHRAMGGTAKRTHSAEVKKNKVKKHVYRNAITGQENFLTPRMHAGIVSGARRWKGGQTWNYMGFYLCEGKKKLQRIGG